MGGLCAICGKDMTALENETAERLLAGRKLSLIVDLDQTIVHATVDPTVGGWISQGAAWEAYQNEPPDKRGTPPPQPNANWDALRDVANFTLPHEGPGQHHHHREPPVMYYIKPRPGLMHFLDKISKKYYTMGTRAYAKRPSRSATTTIPLRYIHGRHRRPRERSPNLVEVVRYDFFGGIGDILLPKADPLLRLPPDLPAIVRKPTGPQPVTVEDEKEELEDELLSRQPEALGAAAGEEAA
ncbi:hypothetical protein EXIGLDRAFT_703299 [Exidia glandulosa HHB12029]|uniref:protein-serine/threonine phosphatase n=1 Tax=Exidia glandulosa HHB12029 TaxID=1314781 RepID=A0A165C448_EXIGL|nr:hypothetical protein EXIGLDRAFT_703299 [Exidia glandulosa HHB12029]